MAGGEGYSTCTVYCYILLAVESDKGNPRWFSSLPLRLWVGIIVPNLRKSFHTKTLDHLRLSARQPMPGLCASDTIAGRLDGDSQLTDGGRGREESRRGYHNQQQLLAGFKCTYVRCDKRPPSLERIINNEEHARCNLFGKLPSLADPNRLGCPANRVINVPDPASPAGTFF